MPNDDERREVARRIRMGSPEWVGDHYEKWLGPEFGTIVLSGGGKDEIERAANQLAGMIDQEPERTCHYTSFDDYDDEGSGINVWYLSCGHDAINDAPYPPNYCPHCGTKVVNDGC